MNEQHMFYTPCFISHCSLYMCYKMSDLAGPIVQMGSEIRLLTWLGSIFIQFDMHCFCGSIPQAAFVCCVVSFVALVA